MSQGPMSFAKELLEKALRERLLFEHLRVATLEEAYCFCLRNCRFVSYDPIV